MVTNIDNTQLDLAPNHRAEEFASGWASAFRGLFADGGRRRDITDIHEILDVLNELAASPNHIHFATGGGHDVKSVQSFDDGSIGFKISDGYFHKVWPQMLTLEYIAERPEESFAFLHIGNLPPEIQEVEDSYRVRDGLEYAELVEVDGELYSRSVRDRGFLGYDDSGQQIPIPERSINFVAMGRGSFLFVAKGSMWNAAARTYSGEHNILKRSQTLSSIEDAVSRFYPPTVEQNFPDAVELDMKAIEDAIVKFFEEFETPINSMYNTREGGYVGVPEPVGTEDALIESGAVLAEDELEEAVAMIEERSDGNDLWIPVVSEDWEDYIGGLENSASVSADGEEQTINLRQSVLGVQFAALADGTIDRRLVEPMPDVPDGPYHTLLDRLTEYMLEHQADFTGSNAFGAIEKAFNTWCSHLNSGLRDEATVFFDFAEMKGRYEDVDNSGEGSDAPILDVDRKRTLLHILGIARKALLGSEMGRELLSENIDNDNGISDPRSIQAQQIVIQLGNGAIAASGLTVSAEDAVAEAVESSIDPAQKKNAFKRAAATIKNLVNQTLVKIVAGGIAMTTVGEFAISKVSIALTEAGSWLAPLWPLALELLKIAF